MYRVINHPCNLVNLRDKVWHINPVQARIQDLARGVRQGSGGRKSASGVQGWVPVGVWGQSPPEAKGFWLTNGLIFDVLSTVLINNEALAKLPIFYTVIWWSYAISSTMTLSWIPCPIKLDFPLSSCLAACVCLCRLNCVHSKRQFSNKNWQFGAMVTANTNLKYTWGIQKTHFPTHSMGPKGVFKPQNLGPLFISETNWARNLNSCMVGSMLCATPEFKKFILEYPDRV